MAQCVLNRKVPSLKGTVTLLQQSSGSYTFTENHKVAAAWTTGANETGGYGASMSYTKATGSTASPATPLSSSYGSSGTGNQAYSMVV